MKTIADYIVNIPDFPNPGVLFRDVTGVLDSAEGLKMAIDGLAEHLEPSTFDTIVSMESRGFIFGMPLAYKFGKSFAPVRKRGKLPRATVSESCTLEYGAAVLEMHRDSIEPGQHVVIVDDLLATGGTAAAAARIIEKLGGVVVKMLFLIELEGFDARSKALSGYTVESVVKYPGK